MPRTILFRGKVVSNSQLRPDEWVIGDLSYPYYNTPTIIVPDYENKIADFYIVEPESVGQFTGFKDSEGAMLFEGDLLIAVPNSSKDDDETEYRILWSNEDGCWIVVENRSGEFFDWLTSDIADKFFSVQEN